MTWPKLSAVPTLGLLLALLGGACSTSEGASDPYAETEGPSTNTGTTGNTGTTMSSQGEGADDEHEGGEDSADTGGALDLPGEEAPECDVWAQDCPVGDKCSWEVVDEVPHPACVPVDPAAKAAGEPCSMLGGPGTGHDDCDFGLICAWLDDDAMGVCLPLCTGSALEPGCEGVEFPASCQPCAACPSLCLPTCNPLDDQCGEGYACTPNAGEFTCLPSAQLGPGALGDPCEYTAQCQAGHACIEAAKLSQCEAAGCCSPFCDLDQPACPDLLECAPWSQGLAEPPLPNLGVCTG